MLTSYHVLPVSSPPISPHSAPWPTFAASTVDPPPRDCCQVRSGFVFVAHPLIATSHGLGHVLAGRPRGHGESYTLLLFLLALMMATM